MNISASQLAGRPRKVGTRDGGNVMEFSTKGGYHLIVAPKGTSFETLAVGPHRAVARHIAQKHHKDIRWTELSKGDWIDPAHYEHLMPKYEGITNHFRRLQGDEPQE